MDYGGGQIMDWTGHHVDIAHWGLGLDYSGPETVEGTGVIPTQGLWNSPTDYDCTCTYKDGLVIKINSKFPMGTKWVGDKGWLFVTRGETQSEPKSIRREKIRENETITQTSSNA
jgi:predicted dehydrogenase